MTTTFLTMMLMVSHPAKAKAAVGGCRAFTVAEARTLATATPNARAFVREFGASLQTAVRSQTASSAVVVVTARDAKHGMTQVGVYTVNLRTGRVTDDDMEPADDSGTDAVRVRMLGRGCAAQ